jgi:hypothetical protein
LVCENQLDLNVKVMEKIQEKILIITSCAECPHYNHDDGEYPHKWGKDWCDKLDKELTRLIPIPTDCPLPNNK